MGSFILRRLLQTAAILTGITLIVFLLMNVASGDPLWALLDQKSATLDEETAQNIRQQWGLDQPLTVQYLRFLGNALKGDLGRSFISRQKVTQAVLERAPATLKLGLAALFIAVALGLAAGLRPRCGGDPSGIFSAWWWPSQVFPSPSSGWAFF